MNLVDPYGLGAVLAEGVVLLEQATPALEKAALWVGSMLAGAATAIGAWMSGEKIAEKAESDEKEKCPPGTTEEGEGDQRKRRTPSPDDIDCKDQDEARREALKRHGVKDVEDYDIVEVYEKNENLKGPKGEPWEEIWAEGEGEIITIDHHPYGHIFKDNGTYELPHYHGPNGEHICYPK